MGTAFIVIVTLGNRPNEANRACKVSFRDWSDVAVKQRRTHLSLVQGRAVNPETSELVFGGVTSECYKTVVNGFIDLCVCYEIKTLDSLSRSFGVASRT